MRTLIRALPQQGITVILSSHILSEVEQTADEVAILAHGSLGYQGALPREAGALEQLFLQVAQPMPLAGEGCAVMRQLVAAEWIKGRHSFVRRGFGCCLCWCVCLPSC